MMQKMRIATEKQPVGGIRERFACYKEKIDLVKGLLSGQSTADAAYLRLSWIYNFIKLERPLQALLRGDELSAQDLKFRSTASQLGEEYVQLKGQILGYLIAQWRADQAKGLQDWALRSMLDDIRFVAGRLGALEQYQTELLSLESSISARQKHVLP